MNEQNTESNALADGDLEQVNGGLFWNGQTWTSERNRRDATGTTPNTDYRLVNTGKEKLIYRNKGQGEYLAKRVQI